MAYKTCRVKNIDSVSMNCLGQTIAVGQYYQVPDVDRVSWGTNDALLAAITADKVQIGDGAIWIESYSDQIDWIKDY